MRWYHKLYLGESLKNNGKYYQFIIKHTRKITGTYCLLPSENQHDLIDIYRSEMLQIPGMFDKDQLVIGIAGTKYEAMMLSGKILQDVFQQTGTYRLRDFLGQECEDKR